jgi:hypothetical protein
VCSPNGTWSHSLPAIAVLAAIAMTLAYAGTRSGGIALVFGVVVLAHPSRAGCVGGLAQGVPQWAAAFAPR